MKKTIFTKMYKKAPYVAQWRYVELSALKDCIERNNNVLSGDILDLGCGSGELTNVVFTQIKNSKKQIIGMDYQEHETQAAKKFQIFSGIVVEDATNMGFKDNAFNVVFANSVIEHIPNQEGLWKEMARVTKKGGHIVLTVPTNRFNPFALGPAKSIFPSSADDWGKRLDKSLKHFHYFSEETFNKKAKEHNLTIVDKQEYAGYWFTFLNTALRTYQMRMSRWSFLAKINAAIIAPLLTPIVMFLTVYKRKEAGAGVAIILRKEK